MTCDVRNHEKHCHDPMWEAPFGLILSYSSHAVGRFTIWYDERNVKPIDSDWPVFKHLKLYMYKSLQPQEVLLHSDFDTYTLGRGRGPSLSHLFDKCVRDWRYLERVPGNQFAIHLTPLSGGQTCNFLWLHDEVSIITLFSLQSTLFHNLYPK